ncbi:hypothetical protein BGP77_11060 [Saccharospirillum sp. MSK14-1]|uniref:hypothetical protein n=1 Tax=Saccharospirillum sp. MSK14-1 TaxID=1897632 RepID=UPI000D343A4A|nr:hypothetical protein [Saccharospirillum sp. MSK14-1]PTY38711.1 hypothetical protein BGP77_11060 [Saccharospirillum sp. MSK14-1]
MDEDLEKSAYSAKSLSERFEKKTREKLQQQAADQRNTDISLEQVALQKKSNDIANNAYLEAQKANAGSIKASRKATWSNIISFFSLIVAIAALVYTVYISQ